MVHTSQAVEVDHRVAPESLVSHIELARELSQQLLEAVRERELVTAAELEPRRRRALMQLFECHEPRVLAEQDAPLRSLVELDSSILEAAQIEHQRDARAVVDMNRKQRAVDRYTASA